MQIRIGQIYSLSRRKFNGATASLAIKIIGLSSFGGFIAERVRDNVIVNDTLTLQRLRHTSGKFGETSQLGNNRLHLPTSVAMRLAPAYQLPAVKYLPASACSPSELAAALAKG